MNTRRVRPRWSLACRALGVVVLAGAVSAQGRRPPNHLVQDWSHQHLVFSNVGPGHDPLYFRSAQDLEKRWPDIVRNPRYRMHWLKLQSGARQAAADAVVNAHEESLESRRARSPGNQHSNGNGHGHGGGGQATGVQLHRDWSNVMGAGNNTTATQQGTGNNIAYPAKFSFDTNTKDCARDFVVYTTSALGATSSGTRYQVSGTFTGPATVGDTFTLQRVGSYSPVLVLTITAGTANIGLTFDVGTSAAESAANLAAAINRNGGTVGLIASATGAVVTVNSDSFAVPGDRVTPTDVSASFSWGGETSGTGTAGQPTIFALNQLYADTVANGGCQTAAQAVPATFWSYNTGTGATADLSPVLSFFDGGAQIAFTQRVGTTASLVLLKWSSGTGTVGQPAVPATAADGASYRSCVAPCMLILSLGANNTGSSPFVDYAGDTLYVGDDNGRVHQFTGVFGGTPVESGSPWPIAVAAGLAVGSAPLSPPVFDGTQLWVGSAGNVATLNRLHRIDTTGLVTGTVGTVTSSAQIAFANPGSNLQGVDQAPTVDPVAGRVFAFVGTTLSTPLSRAVFQFDMSTFTTNVAGTQFSIGSQSNNSSLNRRMFAGAFDQAYYNTGTGFLYVCGSNASNNRQPTLWQIPADVTAGLGTPVQGAVLTSNDGWLCSPLTAFTSGGVDRIFASVEGNGIEPGCAGACIYAFNISTGASFNTTSTSTAITANTDYFLNVATAAPANTTESAVQTTVTQAGTYFSMAITQGGNAPAGGVTYTLRQSPPGGPAVDTALSCTVAQGANFCNALTGSATFAVGDLISVRVRETAAQTTTRTVGLGWNLLTPATAGLQTSAPGVNGGGSTGGIVVDNIFDPALGGGGAQIYYATLAPPGVVVQASQRGLQ